MSEERHEEFYNDHPDYADGWRDACDGEPLFPDASEPYAAGWHGWYAAKKALDGLRLSAKDSQVSKSDV